jgi:hypothetical protein
MGELGNSSIPSSSTHQGDHRLTDEAVEEDDHRLVDEAVVKDDISWSRLDIIFAAYVLLAIWGPVFAALLLSVILPLMKPDLELNLTRALGWTGGILVVYLLAMARLSRRQPLFFLYAVYYTLLFYMDLCGALFILLLVPDVAVFYLLIPIVGWLFLILVARRIILASHDYLFSDTMLLHLPRDQGDDRLKPILQRGIDENTFRYKYVPKTHLILICNMCIFVGIIVGGLVWKPSLNFSLPVSFVCVVDIFYSSCFRFEDEDKDALDGLIQPPDGLMQPHDGLIQPPDGLILQPPDALVQLASTTRTTTQEEHGGLV